MYIRRITAAVFFLSSMISGAFAADLPEEQTVYAPPPGMIWTGFYVGAFAGYHFSRLTQEGCTGLCPTSSDGPSGALLGVQGGYDYQFSNNVVLGAFAAVPLLRPETTVHLGGGADFKVSPQFAATAAVRLGYAMDQWLPFAFAGVGYANIEAKSSVTGATPSNDHFGYIVGAGVEYAFTRNWTVNAKYTFSSLGKEVYDFGGGFEKYGEDAHNVTIGVNYRF